MSVISQYIPMPVRSSRPHVQSGRRPSVDHTVRKTSARRANTRLEEDLGLTIEFPCIGVVSELVVPHGDVVSTFPSMAR